jgi:hypothetical protein
VELADLVDAYPWYPWDHTEEQDRGFGHLDGGRPCVVRTDIGGANQGNRATHKLWRLTIGDAPVGMYYMHLCERFREGNRCVWPAHIKIGTPRENNLHWNRLAREAGQAYAPTAAHCEAISEGMKKFLADPANRQKWRDVQSHEPHSPEMIQKLKDAANRRWERPGQREAHSKAALRRWAKPGQREAFVEKHLCLDCGKMYTRVWMSRHVNEGRCERHEVELPGG